MNQRLLLVTGNRGKAAEIAAILGRPVETTSLDIPEIQDINVETVARAKARAAWDALHLPLIVDDTGFAINVLNGLPGAFIAWHLKCLGPAGILRMVAGQADRRVRVTTCIAYADLDGRIRAFPGHADGTLPFIPRGEEGFGYDSIFIPEGHDRTYAELGREEKNRLSMRRHALERFKAFLDGETGP